jgi:hypothetical protein
MTCGLLGRLGGDSKQDVSNKVANEYGQHDPTVVGHEKQPGHELGLRPFARGNLGYKGSHRHPSSRKGEGKKTINLHHHKGVEALYRVQQGFDDMRPLVHFDLVTS